MVNEEFQELARQTLLPVILGHGLRAHRFAASLYRRYGVQSMVCGSRRSLLDLLDPNTFFLPLFHQRHPLLAAEQLMDFARCYEDLILLLIPVGEEQRSFGDDHRELLEGRYIFCNPQEVADCPPMKKLREEKGWIQ